MIDVEVLFKVKSGGQVREERRQLSVEEAAFKAALGTKEREKLGAWAKTLFPGADWARVVMMKRR